MVYTSGAHEGKTHNIANLNLIMLSGFTVFVFTKIDTAETTALTNTIQYKN